MFCSLTALPLQQVIWDSQLNPSSLHGVTTALIGNCGVGFAPVRKEHAQKLIELMEGVEDIPEAVLADGLDFSWETFPDYLEKIAARPHDIDVCALVPHAAVRVYVMGQRAVDLEPATDADISQMRRIISDAVRAGAFGFSTSRTLVHKTTKGESIPTYRALEAELEGLARGLQDAGAGLIEVNADFLDVPNDFALVRRICEKSGRPATFLLAAINEDPTKKWRTLLQMADKAASEGVNIRPVFPPRPVGVLFGLLGSQNPFVATPTFRSIAHLPLEQRVAAMKNPETKKKILSEDRLRDTPHPLIPIIKFERMFRLTDPPNYTPPKEESVAAIAERAGKTSEEVAYDMLVENGGKNFLWCAVGIVLACVVWKKLLTRTLHVDSPLLKLTNYTNYDLAESKECLENRNAIMGLSDGGAHCGMIMDASFQSFALEHWVKAAGMPIEEMVRRLTSDTAISMGLTDRGVLRAGLKADINVIDLEALTIRRPEIVHDLPSGGRRLMQRADGYIATLVNGVVTYRHGKHTGALPGRLVRCEGG